ncbi:Mov34/MPN/PAD-1 family protein [Leptolyngbya sp. PL-A3]|uniref:Mov34/MPN/PAD-1 family protein n=1 Tax=Leptolyngbya sp. PL-A3 TaxID=2933911 RepID=UPI003297C572
MMKWLLQGLKRQRILASSAPQTSPKLILTEVCLRAIRQCLLPEIERKHEGITYLLGRTNGCITIAATAVRPEAQTTSGSFEVASLAMARVVRCAAKLNLQVVAQVHTHPTIAFHSKGDEEGARIKYNGYASIVLPDYGQHLPSLKDAAVYIFQDAQGFVLLSLGDITIAPEIVL